MPVGGRLPVSWRDVVVITAGVMAFSLAAFTLLLLAVFYL